MNHSHRGAGASAARSHFPWFIAPLVGVLAFSSAPVSAHVPGIVTPDAAWRSWSVEPLVLTLLVVTSWVYARGRRRLAAGRAHDARRMSPASAWCFAAGQAAVVAALVSPLDALGGTLLSAHMLQHAMLAGVAPPLLLLGAPGVAFVWGVRGHAIVTRLAPLWRSLARFERAVSSPLRAAVIHGVTMWVWHAPMLFDLAVAHEWVHALQHACFFVSALLFWRAVLAGLAGAHAPGAAAAAFVTFMHTGLLGALITLAPAPLYPVYVGRTGSWGLTALADQQLAGLLMWVPVGIPYVIAGLVLMSSFVRDHVDVREPAGMRAASRHRVDSPQP